jgi:hypothetical protein
MEWESLLWAAAGLVLVAPRALILFRGSLNVRLFSGVVAKLMREGHRDRALSLCDAAPHAFYTPIARAIIEAAPRGRSAGSTLRNEPARGAFEAERTRQLTRIRRHGWTLALAASAALVGALLAIAADPTQDAVLPVTLAAIGLIVLDRRRVRAFERDSLAAGEELVAVVTNDEGARSVPSR